MAIYRRIPILCLVLFSVCAWAEDSPHIGYLYPAGGQQGQDVLIVAGGQFLQRPQAVYVSGRGVKAEIVNYYRPLRNIQREQRELLISRMQEVRDQRIAELPAAVREKMTLPPQNDKPDGDKKTDDTVKMPEHPLLYDLEHASLRQLAHIAGMLFMPRSKLQPNRQIAEMLLIKVTIDADAAPGTRELRIKTFRGLTNPMTLQVGTLPEYAEMEPNDRQAYPTRFPQAPRMPELPGEKALDLPVTLNGQIMPGDIDRFRFRARAGQPLVIQAHARSLVPYLADAVPGWFQATVAVYDADGNEVAYADDYRFDPDPVLYYQIPKTGEYELAIRDSIYRGREDFVYRIRVGELPFVTAMFPLGGKVGEPVAAAVTGWNLPVNEIPLDTASGKTGIRHTMVTGKATVSNELAYAVDALSECREADVNEPAVQPVTLPVIINGRIESEGDVDVYRFEGKAGDEIAASVCARRLGSPLDALLRLTDAAGTVVAWNDDYVATDTDYLFKDTTGLLTHHADAALTAALPADGTYTVQITDAQQHGGAAYGYRLRLTVKTGDFALRVTPSSLSPLPGQVLPVTVYVMRQDGFDGPIQVSLKDAPDGFRLTGGTIPPGCEHIRMTLKAPDKTITQPVVLQLEGRAAIGDEIITHPVIPADDMMQAFLYRHLVPSHELMVSMLDRRWTIPTVTVDAEEAITVPAGASVRVQLNSRARRFTELLQLELQNPPSGITLDAVKVVPGGLALTLKADATAAVGLTDNLIIEAARKNPPPADDPSAKPRTPTPVGVIPAIPIRIGAAPARTAAVAPAG